MFGIINCCTYKIKTILTVLVKCDMIYYTFKILLNVKNHIYAIKIVFYHIQIHVQVTNTHYTSQ